MSATNASARDGAGAFDDPIPLSRRLILVALTAIGPVSFQIFLPALHAIQEGFSASPGRAQLALSLSMLGIAGATLAYGRLSDRYGRRPVLLAGMAILLAGSLLCAVAPSIEVLIAGRIVQAAGGASGMVVTRAIVLDLVGRERASRVIAGLMTAMMIAPMLATPVGGFLTDVLGWRANFAAIGIAAAATLALVFLRLEETHRGEAEARPGGTLGAYRRLLASASFDGFAFAGAFSMGAFIVLTTNAPTYLTGHLGVSATNVGLLFVLVSAGFMAGGIAGGRLSSGGARDWGTERLVLLGATIGLAATVGALGWALAGTWTVAALIGPAVLLAFGNGIAMPNAQAGAMAAVRDLSGTASGLSGFLGTLVGAAGTQSVAMLLDGTPLPITVAMAGASALALGAAMVALRSGRADRDPSGARGSPNAGG